MCLRRRAYSTWRRAPYSTSTASTRRSARSPGPAMSRSAPATLTAGGNNASTTYSGTISGSGGFNKAGSGTLLLTGTSTYTGVTNIDGGTFEVDGAITSSSSVNGQCGRQP